MPGSRNVRARPASDTEHLDRMMHDAGAGWRRASTIEIASIARSASRSFAHRPADDAPRRHVDNHSQEPALYCPANQSWSRFSAKKLRSQMFHARRPVRVTVTLRAEALSYDARRHFFFS
jgi:hypothetical protein